LSKTSLLSTKPTDASVVFIVTNKTVKINKRMLKNGLRLKMKSKITLYDKSHKLIASSGIQFA